MMESVTVLGNLQRLVVAGLWRCLSYLAAGIACLTIMGTPFGPSAAGALTAAGDAGRHGVAPTRRAPLGPWSLPRGCRDPQTPERSREEARR